jgi:thiol-disulfide isomerase/thioredoxin
MWIRLWATNRQVSTMKAIRLLPLLAALALGGCGDPDSAASGREGAKPAGASQLAVAPDFTLPDLDGAPQQFNQWKGKVVLLNFWAPWCPPCRAEVPALVELSELHGDDGVVVVGVTLDTRENAQNFVDFNGVEYPVLIAEEEGIELGRRFGNKVGALPYSVFIDREGRIRHTTRQELTLESAEAQLLPLL